MAPRTSSVLLTQEQFHSALLNIPLELREQIYAEVLFETPGTLPQLLQCNRQISEEARPFLYRQPISFDGQANLFNWLERVDRKHLRHVTTIKFKLHDIEPEKIVGALGERLRRTRIPGPVPLSNENPYHIACNEQVKKIGKAFSLLPNVTSFTFLECEDCDPHPSVRMLVSLSHEVAHRFPNLQSLTIQTDLLSTTFISKLPYIRSLSITGFSISTATETQSILSPLADLVSLTITGPSTNLSFQQRPGYTGPLRVQTITPSTLRSLPKLKSLSIIDARDVAAHNARPRFLTPAFINAFSTLNSLETLRLATNYSGLHIKVLQSFRNYLSSPACNICHLDLGIPVGFRITDGNSPSLGGRSRPSGDIPPRMEVLEKELLALEEDGAGFSEVRVCVEEKVGRRGERMKKSIERRLAAMDVACKWGVWEDWVRELY